MCPRFRVARVWFLNNDNFYPKKPVFTKNFESSRLHPAVWDQRVLGEATIAVEAGNGAHGKYALSSVVNRD